MLNEEDIVDAESFYCVQDLFTGGQLSKETRIAIFLERAKLAGADITLAYLEYQKRNKK